MPAPRKSILAEIRQIERAIALIKMGARLQLLRAEIDIGPVRLLQLYREVSDKPPSKGLLPYSTDWFMRWQPNIHASLFFNIHEYLNKVTAMDGIDTLIKAYQLYIEQTSAQGLEARLSITRAWCLVKFMDAMMLAMTRCSKCGGNFVSYPYENPKHYVCGLCFVPSSAGRGKAVGCIKMRRARRNLL